ncbi:MAG: exodeoxyribonuclease VII small subunit [Deltaproteobacteria bacterium]|nr:exodeoxyribonuclease VII small subunit [Deltaproteobacteria bacterium]
MSTIEKTTAKAFELCLSELEQVVRKLEGGELTLDESLEAFEKGIGLARDCEKRLDDAKGRIEQLIKVESNEAKTAPFIPKD